MTSTDIITNNTCGICIEDMGVKGKHVEVTCLHCDNSACRTCCETFMVDTSSVKCMFPDCGREWSNNFICDNFSKQFVSKSIKRIRENNYFEYEKSQLPATQALVNEEMRVEERALYFKHHTRDMDIINDTMDRQRTEIHDTLIRNECDGFIIREKGMRESAVFDPSKYWPVDRVGPYGDGKGHTLSSILGTATDERKVEVKRLLVIELEHCKRSKKAAPGHPKLPDVVADNTLTDFICAIALYLNNALNTTPTPRFYQLVISPYTKEWGRYVNKVYLKDEIAVFYREIKAAYAVHNDKVSQMKPRVKSVSQFIKSCPSELCKGFLSTKWKCGLCNDHVCSKCHVIIGQIIDVDHECNDDDVATAKMIAMDAKPCPGCHVNITKIDGCDQMWCTQCKTAWDWKSGTIEKRVHNPHYFEYLRTQESKGVVERNPNEVRCGREVDEYFVNDLGAECRRLGMANACRRGNILFDGSRCWHIIRTIMHVERSLEPLTELELDTTRLRVNYMRNRITESDFKRRVQMTHKRFDKTKEQQAVLSMFVRLVTEIMYRYLDELRNCDTIEQLDEIRTLDEIDQLTDYVNSCLANISRVYQSIPLQVTMGFTDTTEVEIFGIYNSARTKPIAT